MIELVEARKIESRMAPHLQLFMICHLFEEVKQWVFELHVQVERLQRVHYPTDHLGQADLDLFNIFLSSMQYSLDILILNIGLI